MEETRFFYSKIRIKVYLMMIEYTDLIDFFLEG